jgi:hypothetical protein
VQLDVPSFNYTTVRTIGSLTIPAGSGLLADAFDPTGGTLSVTAVNGEAIPAGSSSTIPLASGSMLTVNSNGSFTYVPAAGFQGDDTFTFTASDGTLSTTANGDINVSAPQIYIIIPTYTTQPGQTLTVDAGSSLLLYVSDFANNPRTVTAVNGVAANVGTPITLSSGATLTVNADGTFTYVPAAGYQGEDSFQFTLSVGTASATGTANVNVGQPQLQAGDRLFMAIGQQMFSAANGLLADVVDSSGATVQVTAINGSAANIGVPVTLPSGAAVTVNADGSFTYVPPTNDLLSSPYAGPIVSPLRSATVRSRSPRRPRWEPGRSQTRSA